MKFILVLLASFYCLTLLGQDNAKNDSTSNTKTEITVETTSGETYKGYFIGQNKDYLEIETYTVGIIKIPTQQIKRISYKDRKNKTDYYNETESSERENFHAVRYFFGTSGFNYKKDALFYRNNVSSLQYGFTDNFSAGIGSAVTLLAGGLGNVFSNIHYTVEINEKLRWKLGLDGIVLFGFNGFSSSVFLGNTGLTFGSNDLNLTATIYTGFTPESGITNPAFSLSGIARIGNKFALISENFLFPEGFGIVSYGLRYIGYKTSLDFGLLNNLDILESFPIGFPFVGIVVKL